MPLQYTPYNAIVIAEGCRPAPCCAELFQYSLTIKRWTFARTRQLSRLYDAKLEQAPMKMTRRVAMKAGLVTAASVLSPPALRADELQYQGKKGIVPMSHHLDTPLAAQNGQLFIDDL